MLTREENEERRPTFSEIVECGEYSVDPPEGCTVSKARLGWEGFADRFFAYPEGLGRGTGLMRWPLSLSLDVLAIFSVRVITRIYDRITSVNSVIDSFVSLFIHFRHSTTAFYFEDAAELAASLWQLGSPIESCKLFTLVFATGLSIALARLLDRIEGFRTELRCPVCAILNSEIPHFAQEGKRMSHIESNSAVLSACVERAARILREDGVIAAPTDTLYGILANALSERAAAKVFAAKLRADSSPLPIFVSEIEDLSEYGRDVPDFAYRLASEFWPGKLTIVVPKSERVPALVSGGLDTVGMRIPGHPVPRSIVSALGAPVTATSANVSGSAPMTSASDVARELGGRLDLVFDGGQLAPSPPSTVIDTTVTPPKILRSGAIPLERIERMTGVSLDV